MNTCINIEDHSGNQFHDQLTNYHMPKEEYFLTQLFLSLSSQIAEAGLGRYLWLSWRLVAANLPVMCLPTLQTVQFARLANLSYSQFHRTSSIRSTFPFIFLSFALIRLLSSFLLPSPFASVVCTFMFTPFFSSVYRWKLTSESL
jgi:hypothetical protein